MADGDMELLEQMRRRRSGWGEEDFDRLYRRFGFREITRPRAPHRVYVHPEFPDLRATVGRHRSLAKGYATTAVRLIETLLARLAEREQDRRRSRMKKDRDYYDGLPWRVVIDPEQQEDGRIIFVASHPEFDGVLGTGETPEAALADLHVARRSMIEALLAEGYPVPEPAVAPSAVE